METLFVENVYQDTGIPKYTFVKPSEYANAFVALRTKGKGVIVEGPSGIGKTTCVLEILKNLQINNKPLTPRKSEDIEYINAVLQDPYNKGTVIIDDFHLLPDETKHKISDLLKIIADERRSDIKLVLIGINRAGDSLIKIAPDLNDRIETIRFESNSESKILELIEKGEKLLNIKFVCKHEIAHKVKGSFHMTQMICQEMCKQQEILETQKQLTQITTPLSLAISSKVNNLKRIFDVVVRDFANGNRSRKKGHVPYLHLLIFLSKSPNGSIQMNELYSKYPEYKFSLSQIADKGYLTQLIKTRQSISTVMHYDETSKVLTIENPKFIFYIQNIDWNGWKRDNGFITDNSRLYDFALSFPGEKRIFAEELFKILTEDYEYHVFYDNDHTADILGKNLENYFKPIYSSEAKYIVVFMDSNYPKKIWTVFESNVFKERFGNNAIIPLIFEDFNISSFDPLFNRGYERLNSRGNARLQMQKIGKILNKKFNDECVES